MEKSRQKEKKKKKRKERMTRKQLRKKRHTHSPTTTIPNEKVLQGGESFVKKERRGKVKPQQQVICGP